MKLAWTDPLGSERGGTYHLMSLAVRYNVQTGRQADLDITKLLNAASLPEKLETMFEQ